MKTETQIAEENISDREESGDMAYVGLCKEHKASCERFLEFLRDWTSFDTLGIEDLDFKIKDEVEDLKQAIDKYNEAGI